MPTFLAESYFHTLDPFAVQFTANFGIRWYGLAYIVGFVASWAIVRWFARTGRSPLTLLDAGDLLFYSILGALLGGRIGHAVFYKPSAFISLVDGFPFWELLAINKGGMSSHGGIIGIIVACTLFVRRRKLSALHVLDMGALACTPGLCLGRIANFINAELWGRALPAAMQATPPWWSVKYPTQISERWVAVLDPARYAGDPGAYDDLVRSVAMDFNIHAPPEALTDAVVAAADARVAGLDALQMIVDPGPDYVARIQKAAMDGQERVVELLHPMLTAFYPSQIFQALTDGPILAAILALLWLKPRKPGVIGCWFLISYGVLRISSEFYRQPDEGIPLLLGFSRGQVLSALIVLAGVTILAIIQRKSEDPMPGLRGRPLGLEPAPEPDTVDEPDSGASG